MSALTSQPARSPRPVLATYTTVRPDLVEVAVAGRTVGYLELVGNLFVALKGERYDLAVEVAQSMSVDVAHAALCHDNGTGGG